MTPISAADALEKYYLEARCRLLDLAAILDRIDRGDGSATTTQDARVGRIREALSVLQGRSTDRAAQVQHLFSLAYDPDWTRPEPR